MPGRRCGAVEASALFRAHARCRPAASPTCQPRPIGLGSWAEPGGAESAPLLDDDLPVHERVDRADVLEGALLLEPDRHGLALLDLAGVEDALLRRRVCGAILVRERDPGSLRDLERARVIGEVLDRDLGLL